MTKPNASQAAIKLARSKKLDLGEVKPANQKTGQITKGDVEAFIKAKDEESAKKATDGAEDQPAAGDDAAEGPDNVGSQSSGDGATPEAEEKAKALAAEKAEEAKAESKGKKGKAAKREIVKFRDDLATVWWCPFCDNSQPGEHRECGGCGAVRGGHLVAAVGDEVTAP